MFAHLDIINFDDEDDFSIHGEHDNTDENLDIVLACPICAAYSTDYNQLFTRSVSKSLFEVDMPYLGENWLSTHTAFFGEQAVQLSRKEEIVPTVVTLNGSRLNIVSSTSDQKFKSFYGDANDELLNFFASQSLFDSPEQLGEHIKNHHKMFWIEGKDKWSCFNSITPEDQLAPVVRGACKLYLKMANTASRYPSDENRTSFESPLTTNALILNLIEGKIFSSNMLFKYPMPLDLEQAITNVTTFSQLCALVLKK